MSDPQADHEKRAKEAVAAAMTQEATRNPAGAAAVASQLVAVAARGAKDPRDTVVAISRGAMFSAYDHGLDLPRTVVELLKSLENLSLMGRVGPEQLMTWVLEGIAEITPQAGAAVHGAIRAALEARFVGICAVFDPLCDKAFKKSQGPQL